jgi:hypothetical protein
VLLFAVVASPLCVPAAEPEPFALRLVPIVEGNRESSFGDDPSRWTQTPLARAAARCGIDVRSPGHPLVVQAYRNQRMFYMFYNTVQGAQGEQEYLIQRIRRTTKDYTGPDDHQPRTLVTHLVEAMKLRGGTFRPDQHFGSFGLGTSYRREIVKECEIGFGTIEGIAEGPAWPFDAGRLFEVVQDQAVEPGLYDKVRFSASRTWKIVAWFDRGGNYGLQVPELGIDAPRKLPEAQDAEPVDRLPDSLVQKEGREPPIVLEEGRGLLNLIIGESTTADIERTLGTPTQVDRASSAAHNYHFKQALTLNVYDQGALNTVTTRPGFTGKTSRGIGLGNSRQQVLERYGGDGRGKLLSYPGVLFYFDARDRVERIVLSLPPGTRPSPKGSGAATQTRVASPRAKFEYKVLIEPEVRSLGQDAADTLVAGLDALGEEGWELVSVESVPAGTPQTRGRFIFKRPK